MTLPFIDSNKDSELGSGATFRLSDLEKIHDRERHPNELREALGDGALLGRLPPLANLRRALFELDYRFVPASDISGMHSLFPAIELAEVLANRTIPFRRTANVVREVVERAPDIEIGDVLFRELCAGSYTFHEGAHAVFYETACALEAPVQGRRRVEVLLASEAFAMAFEQLVALLALAQAGRGTRLFLALSAYANPLDYAKFESVEAGSVLRLARLAVDCPANVLSFLASAHLVALMRPTASAGKPELVQWISRYAALQPTQRSDAERLFGVGLHVDFDFRDRTQRNFFGYLGLGAELDAVRSEPLENSFAGDAAFHAFLPPSIKTVLDFPS